MSFVNKLSVNYIGKNIFLNGFPPLNPKPIISSATSHIPGKNRATAEILKSFDVPLVETHLVNVSVPSRIWIEFGEKREFLYANEDNVKSFVKDVIVECVNALGLSRDISVLTEVEILGERPDVWLIYSGKMPIGVIEVKKPGDIFNNEFVLGQSFDYLNILSTFYGIEHPFCILSTYVQWRLVWLPSKKTDAYVLNNLAVDIAPNWTEATMHDFLSYMDIPIHESIDRVHLSDAGIPTAVLPRFVNVSQIINYTDSILAKWLCSIIRKTYCCPRNHVSLVSGENIYIKLTENTMLWEKLPSNILPGSFLFSMPPTNTKNYFLIKDLHGGLHGRVWLGVSPSGHLVVFKFPKKNNRDEV